MSTICIFQESVQTKEFLPYKGLYYGSCKKLTDAGYQISNHSITEFSVMEIALMAVSDGDLKMLWFRGHGSSKSVSFVDYQISTDNMKELDCMMTLLTHKFAPDAYILIDACLSGEGADSIAAYISAAHPNVTVVANNSYGVSALVVPGKDGRLLFRMDGRYESQGQLCRTDIIYLAGKSIE